MGAVRGEKLVEITCDEPGCKASIKPHPQIAESGWVKVGFAYAFAEHSVNYYCPDHAPIVKTFEADTQEEADAVFDEYSKAMRNG